MVNLIKKFFKNKFNLIILIVISIALIFCAFSSLWYYFAPISILLFGTGCIIFSIKMFVERRHNKIEELSMFFPELQTKRYERESKNEIRSKVFYGIVFLILGLIFLYSSIMGFFV